MKNKINKINGIKLNLHSVVNHMIGKRYRTKPKSKIISYILLYKKNLFLISDLKNISKI